MINLNDIESKSMVTPKLESDPLSPMQEAMIAEALLHEGKGYDIQQFISLINEVIDIPTMETAIQTIWQQNPILRTVLLRNDSDVVQQVHDNVEASIKVIDFSHLPDEKQHHAFNDYLLKDRATGFRLFSEPMIRFTLFKLDNTIYKLLITYHHILLDGRANFSLLAELMDSYVNKGAVTGKKNTEFSNYSEYMHQHGNCETRDYWCSLFNNLSLSDSNPFLSIVPREDKAIPHQQIKHELSTQLTEQLFRLAKHHGVSMSTLLDTVWSVLLYRYLNDPCVCFGTVRSYRGGRDKRTNNFGMNVNTLPIAIKIDGRMGVVELIKTIRRQQVAMRDVMHTKPSDLKTWAGLDGQDRLFDTLTVYDHRTTSDQLACYNERFQSWHFELLQRPTVPLVFMGFGGDQLTIDLQYDPQRIDGEFAEKLASYVVNLLTKLPDRIGGTIAEWTMLSEDERHVVVEEWNRTACDYPRDLCLHQGFEQQVKRQPQATAVIAENESLTYGELDRAANGVANTLQRMGCKAGSLVGVRLERTTDLVVGIIGVLKAGCAYVPFDDHFSAHREAQAIQRLGITYMIASESKIADVSITAQKLSTTLKHVLYLPKNYSSTVEVDRGFIDESIWSLPEGIKLTPISLTADQVDDRLYGSNPDDLAYVIFTSGSTGQPKGVMVRHRPVINMIDWVNKTFNVGTHDRILSVTSLCFDLSVYDIFGVLAAGGSIRITSVSEQLDLNRLRCILDEEPITFWNSAPAYLEQILNQSNAVHNTREQNSMRLFFLSGDWIPVDLPEKIRESFADPQIISLGGATEAAVWSNYYPIGEIIPTWRSIPYGRPIQNAHYYVLDRDMNPVPINVPGELYIGGECLADGYAAEPELTAEKFISDPFSELPNEKMYKTGDLVRWCSDGEMEILGRIDQQIKIRGYRVELGEIRAVICDHASVEDAVVHVSDLHGQKKIIAGVVCKVGANFDLTELLTYLVNHLPHYMLPESIVELQSLPLTPNGKVNYRLLVEKCHQQDQAYLRQKNCVDHPVKQILINIFERTLGIPCVRLTDSFWGLGGDSLQLISLVLEARKEGLKIRPELVYRYPVVDDLANAIIRDDSAFRADYEEPMKSSLAFLPIKESIESPLPFLPITPIQHWFFDRQLLDPQHYSMAFAFSCPASLKHTVKHVLTIEMPERHAALRLRFEPDDDTRWSQVFEDSLRFRDHFKEFDLSDTQGNSDRVILIVEEQRRKLEITKGPLWQALWFDRGPQMDAHLVFIAHHLIFDGVSLAVLLNELEIYCNDRETTFTRDDYLSWVMYLHEIAETSQLRSVASEWLRLPWQRCKMLPRDFQKHRNTYGSSHSIEMCLAEKQTVMLLNSKHPIDVLLMAAIGLSLHDWSGDGAYAIDYTANGRESWLEEIDLSATIGYINAIAPVLIDLKEASSLEKLVLSLSRQLSTLRKHMTEYGVAKYLAAETTLVKDVPKPQIKFNYHGKKNVNDQTIFKPANYNFPGLLSPDNHRAYVFNFESQIINNQLVIQLKYSEHLHYAETVQDILSRVVHYLSEMCYL